MSLYKSSGDNRMISQHMSKLTHTLKIKDQDILTPDTTLISQEENDLSNSFKQTTPIFGSNSSPDKTSGKLIKEAYTTAQISAGGSYQTVTLLGTWSIFSFLFSTDMYLYDHMTSTHMTAYLYNRTILSGTSLFPPFVCFPLFSPYGSL